MIRDSGFGIQDSESRFGIRDSGFDSQVSGFWIRFSGLGIGDSGLGIRNSNFRLWVSRVETTRWVIRLPNPGHRKPEKTFL